METLSIIAYKQPISKTEIENIRGVNCDYAVQKLLDKSLIEITGKADTIGRPMLYGTTPKFMEYFAINDLSELPVPKEATADINTIGQNAESPELEFAADEVAVETEGGEVMNAVEAAESIEAAESVEGSEPELTIESAEGIETTEAIDNDVESTEEAIAENDITNEQDSSSDVEEEVEYTASADEGEGEPDDESPDQPEEPEKQSDAQA